MTQVTYLPDLPSEIDIWSDIEKEIAQREQQAKSLRRDLADYMVYFINGQIDADMVHWMALLKVRTLENTLERIRILTYLQENNHE